MSDITLRNIGLLLGKRQRQLRFTTAELCRLTGLSRPTIRSIMDGKDTLVSNLIVLCKVLDIRFMLTTEDYGDGEDS